MSTVKKRLSMKKYREENYSSVTNPRIKNKELKTCTLCPAKYYSNSVHDRFCSQCRKKARRMYA
tara:strand:- start:475 stop:666 length:192 start_codon:yes stop_codon:yes gene_type:complete